ncbi:hypothetical protein OF83DRAFT_404060 [Amylostereum chailletii]|nr:hypothetical protein OF83DRAFT_404060 [Amylostereum chailletii]
MSVPPESPLDLSNTYGAVFVGVVLSWFLAGVSTIQTVQYFHKYGDDSRFLKLTVGSLWIWTIASGIVITTPVWTRAIMHWGDSATLATCPSALIHATWMSVFVGVAVQLFFIHRIWLLSRKRYWHICTVLMALALYQQGAIVAYGVIILQQRDIYILSRTITIINGLAISVRGSSSLVNDPEARLPSALSDLQYGCVDCSPGDRVLSPLHRISGNPVVLNLHGRARPRLLQHAPRQLECS